MSPPPIARTVACPSCGAAVVWDNGSRFRPFCSERCRLIDLGAWASESYRVPVNDDPTPSDDALSGDTSTQN